MLDAAGSLIEDMTNRSCVSFGAGTAIQIVNGSSVRLRKRVEPEKSGG